jgi:hypothetical protein
MDGEFELADDFEYLLDETVDVRGLNANDLAKTEDGRTRIQCRFEHETIWLTQALIAELFQVAVPTVNEHLKDIFGEGELEAEATIRKFRIVRWEGRREVAREIEHYRLEAILAVGYRVRSHRGTQFLDSQPRPVDADFEKAVKELKYYPHPAERK